MALAILRSSPASGSPSPPSRRAATQPCGGIWDAFCAREAKGPLGALLTEAHFPVLLDLIALSRHGRGGSSGRDCKRWESLQALGASSCYALPRSSGTSPGPLPELSCRRSAPTAATGPAVRRGSSSRRRGCSSWRPPASRPPSSSTSAAYILTEKTDASESDDLVQCHIFCYAFTANALAARSHQSGLACGRRNSIAESTSAPWRMESKSET